MAHLYPQYLYKTQDFLARFVHSGNNIQCQREINKILKKFDVSEFDGDFRGADPDFLTLFLRKLLEEFWKRPFLLERKKENSVDFQTQIIEREKVICKVIKTTYQILNPPEIQMKRLADMIYENIRAYFDTKLDVIDAETESEDEEVVGGNNVSGESENSAESEIESGLEDVEKNEDAVIDGEKNEEIDSEKNENVIIGGDENNTVEKNDVESAIENVEKIVPAENSGEDIEVKIEEEIVGGKKDDGEKLVETNEILPGTDDVVANNMPEKIENEKISDAEDISPVEEKKDNINSDSQKTRNIYFRRQFGDPNLFGGTLML